MPKPKTTTTEKDTRFKCYGAKKDIAAAEAALATLDIKDLPEPKARLVIQKLIDKKKLRADVLFDGNTVWSYDRLIRDFKRFLENPKDSCSYTRVGPIIMPTHSGPKGMTNPDCAMTNYLYHFLSLDTGSIAHFDKEGWHAVYPDADALRAYFKKNEFGQKVVDHIPYWHTDAIRIAKEMERLLKVPKTGKLL